MKQPEWQDENPSKTLVPRYRNRSQMSGANDLVPNKVTGVFILRSVGRWVSSWDYFSHWRLMFFMQLSKAFVTKFWDHLPFCNPWQIKCVSSANSAICFLAVSMACSSSTARHVFWAILLENNILCLLTKVHEYGDRELSNHFVSGSDHPSKATRICWNGQGQPDLLGSSTCLLRVWVMDIEE